MIDLRAKKLLTRCIVALGWYTENPDNDTGRRLQADELSDEITDYLISTIKEASDGR